LTLPWKYGFKSAKAPIKIRFVEKRPSTLWEAIGPTGIWLLGERQPGLPASALEPGVGAAAGQ
jgi:DMSO/TMAO reductase YedYZ molybdopterin-dependent catalytic subunit